jgi:AraC-like DNA-binding protein
MEHIELLLRLKGAEITYQEFNRPSGYTGRIIHMHDANEICFIASRSECLLFSGGNRRTISGPAIFFHRAGSYHELLSVSADSAPYDSRLVYFQTEGLPEEFLPQGLFSHDCTIHTTEDAAPFLACFELLKSETGNGRKLALLLWLERIGKLPRENVISGDAVESYIFDMIKDIPRHLADDLTLRELAQQYHVSESKLKKDFAATTGMTVKQFTTSLRLRQACNLLQNTDLDVADVAYRCGFSGESHFIETFRTRLGTTPGKFRKDGKTHV